MRELFRRIRAFWPQRLAIGLSSRLQRVATLLLLFPALAIATGCSKPPAVPPDPPIAKPTPAYSVEEYDPTRDPAADLAATLKVVRDQPTPRHVLLLVGGNSCGWCVRLERYMTENEEVAATLRGNYIVMKVNASAENDNEEFLSGFPDAGGGVPQFHVLDGEGTHLHAQSTAELEDGTTYSSSAMIDFLNRWKPGAVSVPGESL